ncbi:hypothetical protein QJS66_11335 [Kocuria rhizophila]|nr:hypothetical protein QJS66_11335 [Kocuria rhizophila]
MIGTWSAQPPPARAAEDEGVGHGWIPAGERWLTVDVREPWPPRAVPRSWWPPSGPGTGHDDPHGAPRRRLCAATAGEWC